LTIIIIGGILNNHIYIIETDDFGTEKIDMYSFGIIFYEMCHEHFKEWKQELSKIRKAGFTLPFPSNFAPPLNSFKAHEKVIINFLPVA